MIAAAIIWSEADAVLVDAFNVKPRADKLGSYWSDEGLAALRGRVKTFYIAAQGEHCCYCARHLAAAFHRSWDLDHIVDRAKYPWFLFTPENLAASCPECNQAKTDKEVLKNPGRKTYPNNTDAFRIVHPHFDSYDDHIYRDGFVYVPKTDKGKFTIVLCDLLRFAVRYIAWGNSASDRRFEDDVDAAFGSDGIAAEAAVDKVAAELTQLDLE